MLRRKHFTPPLVSALYARDPPTNRPPTQVRTETAAEAISGYRYNNNMQACATQPPTHPPLTSAQVKRITAHRKHFTPPLEGILHTRDPPTTTPTPPTRA